MKMFTSKAKVLNSDYGSRLSQLWATKEATKCPALL